MDKEKETSEVRGEMRQEESKNPSSSSNGSKLADLAGGFSWIGSGIIILIMFIGGGFFLVKSNPPLESALIASSAENDTLVIEIVNNGFRDAKITDVSVNNNETPSETKIQVSNGGQGFIMTDDYDSEEAKEYNFTNLEEAVIKVDTSPEDGTVSNENEIFGLSIIHKDEIHNVEFEYSYFGMSFTHTEYIDALN